ncbi:MAG TPA: thiolase family protein [Acidobacteriota bacterium]|nr:thiolase family protein [Acidobacteriota bacterium]
MSDKNVREVYVLQAKRTPIGRFGGVFKDMTAVELGIHVTKALLNETGVKPEEIDEAIFGQARPAGTGPNPARQVSYRSGLPDSVPAFTVNKACGSGLKSLILGAQSIQLGQANCVLVGGIESMSRVPFLLDHARFDGYRLGHGKLIDAMYQDGFHCSISDMLMGETAEKLAQIHNISRGEQDQFALESQKKAGRAIAEGKFKDEIAAVPVKVKKETQMIDKDEHPRPDTTIEALAKLPPVFNESGTVTAGNSSGITDAASAILLCNAEFLEKHRLKPLARVVGYEKAGVPPDIMGIGPVPATQKLLENLQMNLSDFALIELNEAFAAQVIAVERLMPMNREILNVNGGAIALGHPIGCTGARITTTLLHELKRRSAGKKAYGLATLCISGGLGLSVAFENLA